VISQTETPNLSTHITHKRETSMPPTVFEPTIPASELPETNALNGVAIGNAIK